MFICYSSNSIERICSLILIRTNGHMSSSLSSRSISVCFWVTMNQISRISLKMHYLFLSKIKKREFFLPSFRFGFASICFQLKSMQSHLEMNHVKGNLAWLKIRSKTAQHNATVCSSIVCIQCIVCLCALHVH